MLLEPEYATAWVVERRGGGGPDPAARADGGGAGGDADADDDARDRGGGASAEGELAIEFVVARRGRAVVKRQTLAELLDFQANGGLLPLPRG